MFSNFVNEQKGYDQSWYKDVKADVVFQNTHLVSIECLQSEYTGGAHGMNTRLLQTFHIKTGKPIELEDIISSGNKDKFLTIADSIFRHSKTLSSREDLNKTGYYFKSNKFELNANFMFTNNGIEFHYNPYEIAPYVMGATTIVIPYECVRKLLTPSIRKDISLE
jgi:hypothetical protein